MEIKNNVVSLSGGKDSTAMLHMMLERGESIHSVVFFDTGWEFPEMHDHIDLVERKTSVEVIRLKPKMPFEYWMFERIRMKGPRVGEVGYGWPNSFDRWCTELKTREIDKFKRKIPNYLDCIGIAFDEKHRMKEGKRYPLIEYGVTENDAIKYCRKLGYTWGGLYDIFNRVSCWCCPLQSLKDLRLLRKNKPELWSKFIQMDAGMNEKHKMFRNQKGVLYYDKRFETEEKQLNLWNFAA